MQQSTEELLADFKAKKMELKQLEQKLAEVEMLEPDPKESARLKTVAKEKENAFLEAMREAVGQYGDNAMDVLCMACHICKKDAEPVTKFGMNVEGILKVHNGEIVEFTGTDKQLYTLLDGCSTEALYSMKEYFNQIYELYLAQEEALNARAEFELAQFEKKQLLRGNILSQMDEVREEINSLSTRVSTALSEI